MLEKKEFTVDGIDYYIMQPSTEVYMEAEKVKSKTFKESLQNGDFLRKQLDQELRERRVWTSQMEAEYETLKKRIIDIEFALSSGGISIIEAKNLALEARDSRNRMVELISSKTSLDSSTCEGKADNAHFKALVAGCVFDKDGNKVYKNYEDYLVQQDTDLAIEAATTFYYLNHETISSDSELPEMKFLKRFKFVNDNNELIDKNSKLIDRDGKHIDENGNYIKWTSDTEFVFVDLEGRELDENKDFKVDFSPFLDEDGNPIIEEESAPKSKAKKPKAKPRTKIKTEDVEEKVEEEKVEAEPISK